MAETCPSCEDLRKLIDEFTRQQLELDLAECWLPVQRASARQEVNSWRRRAGLPDL